MPSEAGHTKHRVSWSISFVATPFKQHRTRCQISQTGRDAPLQEIVNCSSSSVPPTDNSHRTCSLFSSCSSVWSFNSDVVQRFACQLEKKPVSQNIEPGTLLRHETKYRAWHSIQASDAVPTARPLGLSRNKVTGSLFGCSPGSWHGEQIVPCSNRRLPKSVEEPLSSQYGDRHVVSGGAGAGSLPAGQVWFRLRRTAEYAGARRSHRTRGLGVSWESAGKASGTAGSVLWSFMHVGCPLIVAAKLTGIRN